MTQCKLGRLITNPDIAVKVHATALVVWLGLSVPSVLWWHSSILWVIFLSLYAIWISHLSAIQAVLADRRVKHGQEG